MLRHRVRHSVLLVLAIVLLVPLPGCNRNDEASDPIVVVTPAPVRGVIVETSYSGFVAGSWVAFPIPISDVGKLDVSINWTHEESWVYVYLGAEACDPTRLADGDCPFLVRSETQTPKPRVIESGLLPPGTYYLYIYNVRYDEDTGIGSYKQESVRIVIGLTVGLEAQGTVEPPQIGAPTVVSPSQL